MSPVILLHGTYSEGKNILLPGQEKMGVKIQYKKIRKSAKICTPGKNHLHKVLHYRSLSLFVLETPSASNIIMAVAHVHGAYLERHWAGRHRFQYWGRGYMLAEQTAEMILIQRNSESPIRLLRQFLSIQLSQNTARSTVGTYF